MAFKPVKIRHATRNTIAHFWVRPVPAQTETPANPAAKAYQPGQAQSTPKPVKKRTTATAKLILAMRGFIQLKVTIIPSAGKSPGRMMAMTALEGFKYFPATALICSSVTAS
jgi:hypothetical protein